MERGYNVKMIRKQILRAPEPSRNDLLEREKPQMTKQKLTLSISYYIAFQNVKGIIEELYILLIPTKEHEKNIFPNAPVIGFQNGKNLYHYLVRVTLPILNESGRCES